MKILGIQHGCKLQAENKQEKYFSFLKHHQNIKLVYGYNCCSNCQLYFIALANKIFFILTAAMLYLLFS